MRVKMKNKELRSGYTTGACAAAAAKAAVTLLLSAEERKSGGAEGKDFQSVEIPFPDGSRVKFNIYESGVSGQDSAWASIIKDGGDDPDITHGAEIMAEARIVLERGGAEARKGKPSDLQSIRSSVLIKGGKGVGVMTKPGLSVPVGELAINPVPRQMIEEAVLEVLNSRRGERPFARTLEITISVPKGEELAKKTLNHRLGIVGGISILGTTGIVKPVSAEAWKATITSSMDVARAMGYKEVVLSAGRTSERAHMKKINLPEEAYVLMGDHLEYSMLEAKRHGFARAYLCAQWAKMLKIAMATPQTHVRFGAIDTGKAAVFLNELGIDVPMEREFNTAREIFDHINAEGINKAPLHKVCCAAKEYAEEMGSIPVTANLVSYDGKVIVTCE
jgi:cobalt-precorrin-5B (C1)-methyltransferase